MRYHVMIAGVVAALSLADAEPTVSFSGMLDADVWGNLSGEYFANSELDLAMTIGFSPDVNAHLYTTVWSGNASAGGGIPAGAGRPDQRWLSVVFDGFDMEFTSGLGTLTVGDLVYQFGRFNYYFYKRKSMIVPESFTRGIRYRGSAGPLAQEFTAGVADIGSSTTDVLGVSAISLSGSQSIAFVYGMRSDNLKTFGAGANLFGGAEYRGSFGKQLKAKADIGVLNAAGAARSTVVSVLVEPVFTAGKLSAALTGYALIDPDSVNNWTRITDSVTPSQQLYGLADELLVYVEPGYRFGRLLGFGVPLEYHGADIENRTDDAVWVVPTFYVYPWEGVEWWLWGQVAAPLDMSDQGYGIGSELIVVF